MHECLLCKRDMKVSNDVFGKGCVRNIYSFLNIKMPAQYYNDTASVAKSIFSSTLYNLASFSIKCAVIKEFDIYIQFYIQEFEVI